MSDMDNSDLGREIGEKFEKFVNSKEIRELQENIKATVEKTMGEIGRSVKDAADYFNQNVEIRWDRPERDGENTRRRERAGGKNDTRDRSTCRRAGEGNAPGGKTGGAPYTAYRAYGRGAHAGSAKRAAVRTRQLPVVRRPEGSVAGGLLVGCGTAGAVIGCVGAFSKLLGVLFYELPVVSEILNLMGLSDLLSAGGLASVGFWTGLGAAGIAAALLGGFLRRRVRRFRGYVRLMGEKDFYPIADLAGGSGRKERAVIKDLKKMIRRRWFREGHLDRQETCFMLTDEAWAIYQNAQKELERQREEAERQKKEQERMEQDPVLRQLKVTVEEGKEYIRRIREVNDDIPGEEISQKLYRLEKITSRIFEHVKDNPDKLPDIRRFMNYYLPTTLKLVESYHEFSIQPVQGENITTARKEIEDMLDEINGAFEKMFDQLFADSAMDISTDISAMSAMLAQEGLLESDFQKKEAAGQQ